MGNPKLSSLQNLLISFNIRFWAVGALCLVAHSGTPAWGAFERAVSWADMSDVDLTRVFQTEYASNHNLYDPVVSDSMIELVLKDIDSKISPRFKVPGDYREAVKFWLKIYVQHTTRHVVIFDEYHHDVVYEVLDFRELAETARNAVVYEILRERKIKRKIAAYKRAFAALRKNPKPRKPTEEQKNILAATRSNHHRHSFKIWQKGLRTQTGQRDNIMKGLVAAEMFFPVMERMFMQIDVPIELTRLSLVESSFNLKAVSRVGATGVWQFMLPTGKEFMTIRDDRKIDERLSPLKSTAAAAKLLKRNYQIMDGWDRAIIAYNHGFKTLKKVVAHRERTRSDVPIYEGCTKGPKLGWAGRNYYAEFLAVLHAETYRQIFYGKTPNEPIPGVEFVRMDRSLSVNQLISKHGLTREEFRFYNPDIRDLRMKLPKGFWILLPSSKTDLTQASAAKSKDSSS